MKAGFCEGDTGVAVDGLDALAELFAAVLNDGFEVVPVEEGLIALVKRDVEGEVREPPAVAEGVVDFSLTG